MEAGNYAAAISALTAKAELAGLWVERTDNKNRTVSRGVAGLTDEELLEIALGAQRQQTSTSASEPLPRRTQMMQVERRWRGNDANFRQRAATPS
jgi:hypothetical protein